MKNLIPQFIAEKYESKETSGSFKGAVMSLDLKGFTDMTEKLVKKGKYGAEVISDIINMIFDPTVKIIRDKGGFISAFVGDAITAVFPDKYAVEAAFAADEILVLIEKLKNVKAEGFSFTLGARIGLAYGKIEWSIINTKKRSVYFFRGKTLYKAADAQQSARTGACKHDRSIKNIRVSKRDNKLKAAPKIKKETMKRFAPDQAIEMKTLGEFRDIVSVFVSFDEKKIDMNAFSEYLCDKPMEYGGYLNKIDFGDKGGIALLFFGAPVAVEKYPEKAVLFAMDLQKSFPEGLRIGISESQAYCGFIGSSERCEYTAMGQVVNLSARLVSKCAEGEILMEERIASYGFKEISAQEKGLYEFKGFSKKIRVFTPSRSKKTARPADQNIFVGRKKEISVILNTAKKAFKNKNTAYIQVNGDAGMGKTRLISAARNELEKNGISWFYMQCDEMLKKSFNPFNYFFKNHFGLNEDNTDEMNMKLIKSGLSEYKNMPNYEAFEYYISKISGMKARNDFLENLDKKDDYENLLHSLGSFFRKKAENSPVVIEIDDIHNIDPDSKEAINVIIRKASTLPVMIISSARFNTDGSVYDPNLIEISAEHISLTSLDKDSVRSLSENILASKIGGRLFKLLDEKCSGNPFYTEQMTLYLKESGAAVSKGGITEIIEGNIEIPDRISSVIISRIDKLSSDLKRLIRTASVLGKEFSVKLLAEVLKKKDISMHLNKAEKEAIWSKATELFYIFKHALLRDTVYEMQLKKTLKELHLITARTIEEVYSGGLEQHYGDLAYHFEKAEAAEDALKYLHLAGNYSAENFRNEEALVYYRKIFSYGVSKEHLTELHRVIGELYNRTGDWKNTEYFFKKSYRMAQKSDSALQLVKSGISLSEYYGEIGDMKKSLSLTKRMLKTAEKNKSYGQINHIRVNLGIICRLMSEKNKAEEYYLKALKYYSRKKDHARIRTIYDNLGVLYTNTGDFKKAEYYFRLAERRSEKNSDKYGLMHIYNNMGMIYYYQGKLEKAIEIYNKSLELADKLGILRHKSIVYGQFAQIYFYKNDCKTALDYCLKAFDISEEMGDTFHQCHLLSSIGVLYRKLNQPDKALEMFEKQRTFSLKIGLKDLISISCANIAFMHTLMGRYKESNELYEEAINISLETGEKVGLAVNYANMGENYKLLKDYDRSLELYHKAIQIDEELQLKYQLVSAYYYISEVYAGINDTESTLFYLDKCKTLSKEINRNDYYFKAEVLAGIIDRSVPAKERAEYLKKLDSEELTEDEKGSLYRAIYLISGSEQYRKKALAIYKGLYEKLKYYEYKTALEVLNKI